MAAPAAANPSPAASPASMARNNPRHASRRVADGSARQRRSTTSAMAARITPSRKPWAIRATLNGAEGCGIGLAGYEHDQQQLGAAGEHLVDQGATGPTHEAPRPGCSGCVAGCGRPGHGGVRRGRGHAAPCRQRSGSGSVGLGAAYLARASALHRTSAAPPAVAAKPAATSRSMSAPVRGSSARAPALPPAPLVSGVCARAPGEVRRSTPGDAGFLDDPGGSGGGLVRAWASAGATVTIMGTANAPVPATAALRRKARRSTALPASPGLGSPVPFPIDRAIYRPPAVVGTRRLAPCAPTGCTLVASTGEDRWTRTRSSRPSIA